MSEIPERPSNRLVEMAVRLGYIGLVSHRTTVQKAYDDAIAFCEQDRGAVGLHLLMNTMTLQWAGERLDMLEMVDAIISYCGQDSRSERRRQAMIAGAKLVHKNLTGEDYGAEAGTRETEEPGG